MRPSSFRFSSCRASRRSINACFRLLLVAGTSLRVVLLGKYAIKVTELAFLIGYRSVLTRKAAFERYHRQYEGIEDRHMVGEQVLGARFNRSISTVTTSAHGQKSCDSFSAQVRQLCCSFAISILNASIEFPSSMISACKRSPAFLVSTDSEQLQI